MTGKRCCTDGRPAAWSEQQAVDCSRSTRSSHPCDGGRWSRPRSTALRHQQPGTLPPTQGGALIPAASHDVALLLRPRLLTHTATGGSTERRCTRRSGPGGGGTMLQLVKGAMQALPCRREPDTPVHDVARRMRDDNIVVVVIAIGRAVAGCAGLITDEEISSVRSARPSTSFLTSPSRRRHRRCPSPARTRRGICIWSAMVGNSRHNRSLPGAATSSRFRYGPGQHRPPSRRARCEQNLNHPTPTEMGAEVRVDTAPPNRGEDPDGHHQRRHPG